MVLSNWNEATSVRHHKLPQTSVLGELHDDAEGLVGRGEGAQELRHVRVVERLDDVVLDDEVLHFLRRVVRLEPLDCHPHETVSCKCKVRFESCITATDRLLKGQEMRWESPLLCPLEPPFQGLLSQLPLFVKWGK